MFPPVRRAVLLSVIPLLFLVISFSLPDAVFAHPLDVAYLDFGMDKNGMLTLTAAIHPYQAFELVRGNSTTRFDLSQLKRSGDLLSAYVEEHVRVSRGGAPCEWKAESAHTPVSELEAIGDGITIAGVLICQSDASTVTAASSLFLENFPQQTTHLRLDLPEGFSDRATLDRSHQTGVVDIAPLFETRDTVRTIQPHVTQGRRPDAPQVVIARRFLDPGLGLWGTAGLLLSAVALGAFHALGPGHGKSLLATVLIGERATYTHLLALGTVMTVTHVSDVFLMAFVASAISAIIPPTQLLNVLQVLSAIGLIGCGVYGIVRAIIRYRLIRAHPAFGTMEDAHLRAHALGLPHAHGAAEAPMHDHAFRRALLTGFVGSLAPCPTAWAIFLGVLSAGRIGAGILLLFAFTIGLYATILLIGVFVLRSRAFALRHTPVHFTYALPVVSSSLVTALGTALLLRLVLP